MTSQRVLMRISWVGLTLIGLLFLVAPTLDIINTHEHGLPSDHATTFTKLAGSGFADVQAASPGVAHYVSTLEYGYALHELTFGLLFIALVLIPLRQGQRWAWFACWAVMTASIGYSATFGSHDPTILGRSLVTDIGVPLLLLLAVPTVLGAKDAPTAAPEATS
jgi:hypothetical protein